MARIINKVLCVVHTHLTISHLYPCKHLHLMGCLLNNDLIDIPANDVSKSSSFHSRCGSEQVFMTRKRAKWRPCNICITCITFICSLLDCTCILITFYIDPINQTMKWAHMPCAVDTDINFRIVQYNIIKIKYTYIQNSAYIGTPWSLSAIQKHERWSDKSHMTRI